MINKTSTPKVYCYTKHYSHFHFFSQLTKLIFFNNKIIYLTDNIALYLYIKFFKGWNTKLIPLYYKKNNKVNNLNEETKNILNWEIAYMQKKNNHVYSKYLRLIQWFENKIETNSIAFCWSGNNTESHAFVNASKNKGCLLFCGEITNYPQTVYLDPSGTNYYSELSRKIKNTMPAESKWVQQLKLIKRKQKHLPQASLKKKTKIFIFLYGIQQFILSKGKRFSVWRMLKNKVKTLTQKEKRLIQCGEFISFDKFWIPKSDEKPLKVLVPLQVNHDTQLHVFSKYKSSFGFIKHLLTLIDDQITLHIKLHPAEKKEINTLTTYLLAKLHRHYPNVSIISDFSFDKYDAIATINSTFGIDALLSGRKVIAFGKSLYSDGEFVLNYSHHDFESLREAISQHYSLVKPDSFHHFAKIIQQDFYNFNYFGNKINQGVIPDKFAESINRLKNIYLSNFTN